MNRIYRTLWSMATQSWQAVPETAKSAGKKSKSSASGVVASFALSWVLTSAANAQAPPAINQLPTGGAVVRGTATISQTATAQAAAMTVNQTSQRAVVNWNTFNIGSNASVNFVQPNAQAVTLNRVSDANPSQIFGRMTANGQVVLTNANGIYFAPGSSVDVGAITATTHRITDDNFMSGKYVFERNGATGKIINEGNITAALAGYVALLAPEVQNAGVVVARAGTVAMAAGETITLNIDGAGSLAGINTTPSAIATLIENKQAVQAPDGQIILSAVALNKLQAGVIKNSGNLEANSLVSKGGKVYLEGDDITLSSTSKLEAKGATGGGTVLVGGDWQGSGDMHQATKVTMEAGAIIDASATDKGDGGKVVLWSDVHNADSVTRANGSIKAEAGPNGGDGGKVETSGHHLHVNDIQVSTQAKAGNTGEWLLDPVDFTIAASGGDMTGAALTALLTGNTDITIQSGTGTNTAYSYFGSTGTGGNINVNDAVSWSKNKLTLAASNNIYINDVMTATGSATLDLFYGQGSVIKMKMGPANNWLGQINLPSGTGKFRTKQGSDSEKTYTVITELGAAGVTSNKTTLQGMTGTTAADAALNYVLGADIDATATSGWTTAGPPPTAGFVPLTPSTAFSGTFDGLGHSISNLYVNKTGNYAGLFAKSSGTIQNLGILAADIRVPSGSNFAVGALAGLFNGVIRNSFTTGSVSAGSGAYYLGGMVGYLGTISPNALISNSYSTVTISSGLTSREVGGLVGNLANGSILSSYATGNISVGSGHGQPAAGGLVGVVDTTSSVTISDSYASGAVSSNSYVGGLIGRINGAGTKNITNNYASGLVTANTITTAVGGLIGVVGGSGTLDSSNNYWNTSTTLQSLGLGYTATLPAQTGLTGLSTAQTKDKTNFTGFDFTTIPVWGMDATSGPYLCGFSTACSVSTQIYILPEAGQSSTYGSAPTSFSYCYSSSATSCSYVSYAGIPSTAQSWTIANGTTQTVNSPSGTITLSGTVPTATSNVGTYALTLTPSLTLAGYVFSTGSAPVNYSVTARPITLTADAKTKVYGEANPSLTYVAEAASSGRGLVNSDTFSGVLSTTATSTSSVGSYSITSTLANSNYTITYTGANLSVTARPITLTADAKTKVYGEANPPLTYVTEAASSSRGLVNNDTFAGVLSTLADGTSSVGNYAITSSLANSNYAITYTGANLSVTARPITLTADAKTKVYGEANPSLTYVTEATSSGRGLVNGDTLTGGLSTTATSTSGIGSYSITSSLANSNYAISYTGANLSVTARPITFTANSVSKTYGDLDPSLNVSITSGSVASFDALADVTGALTRTSGENVGNYDVVLGSGAKTANYNITYSTNNQALTINKANLTKVNASKSYDGLNTVTAAQMTQIEGVNGETFTASAGLASISDKNVVTANKILTDLSGLTLVGNSNAALSSNYNLNSNLPAAGANNQVTINVKALSLSIPGATRVYDGTTIITPSGPVTLSGVVVGEQVNLGTGNVTGFVDKNVGTNKTVTYSGLALSGNDAVNYALPLNPTSNANITPASLSISGITAADKTYDAGTTATVNTANVLKTGLIGSDVVSVNVTGSFTDKNVGTAKTVNLSSSYSGADAGNYIVIDQASTTASITPAPLTVTALDALKNFGAANPAFSVAISGYVGGETAATSGVTGAGSATSTATDLTDVGTAPITPTIGTLSATNYAFTTFVDGTLTIKPISAMNNAEVSTLIGAQLANLTSAQVSRFSATQLQVFSPQQLSALSPSQLAGLTNAQLLSLTPVQLAAISPARIASMTPDQLAELSANQVTGLTVSQLQALSATQFSSFSDAQLQALSASQVTAITTGQLSALTSAQIELLTSNPTATLAFTQILALTPAQIVGVDSVRVANLTAAEIGSLSDAQLQALSVSQIAAIAPDHFSSLSPAQIMALSITQVINLTPEQLRGLSPAQVASISAAELAYFDARQLAAIGIYPKVETPAQPEAEVVVTAATPENNKPFEAAIPVMTEVAAPTMVATAPPMPATEQAPVAKPEAAPALSPRVLQGLLFDNNTGSSASTGVLPVTILNNAAKPITAGVAFEQEADTVSLRTTNAPAVPPMSAKLVFSDKLTTFMVAAPNGEMVAFEGSLVNNRMVIVAPSIVAKRLARVEMNLVLAAAVTSLGKTNRVMLAELKGVLLDLR